MDLQIRSRLPFETERLIRRIIGCAIIAVHRTLGPGFLETVYREAMCLELDAQGLTFEREKQIVVRYRGREIHGHRVDLVVADCTIVELKAVDHLAPIHEAQVASYLRATGLRIGLLLNFNARVMKEGVRRIVV